MSKSYRVLRWFLHSEWPKEVESLQDKCQHSMMTLNSKHKGRPWLKCAVVKIKQRTSARAWRGDIAEIRAGYHTDYLLSL